MATLPTLKPNQKNNIVSAWQCFFLSSCGSSLERSSNSLKQKIREAEGATWGSRITAVQVPYHAYCFLLSRGHCTIQGWVEEALFIPSVSPPLACPFPCPKLPLTPHVLSPPLHSHPLPWALGYWAFLSRWFSGRIPGRALWPIV